MTTWFDQARGEAQGRIEPQSITPPDALNTFILGADGDFEVVRIGDGDFTEVKAVADLTDLDLVGATLDTIGVVMSQYQEKAGWINDANTLIHFDFDFGGDPALNLVSSGFNLAKQGDMATESENYSPDQTYCRAVPVGSITGYMGGVNTPQAIPAALTEYTIQWWMNFLSDEHAGSSGINPKIFSLVSPGVGGLELSLSGVAGPSTHEWFITMRHVNGGTDVTQVFNLGPGGAGVGLKIDPSPGWHLYTLRFDNANGWPTQAELFEDTTKVAVAAAAFTVVPAQPSAAQALQYADMNLWGQVDRFRLLDKWLSDAEIATAYSQCVNAPSAMDYEWEMMISIGGVDYGSRIISPIEQRRWTDWKVPVRRLTGEHEVAFRLALKEIP